MRFSKVMRVLVASAAATVIAASGASAVEISANAVADGAERVAPATTRSIAAPTSLSLSASKTKVKKGKKVTFSGTLVSSDAGCWGPGQVIDLYRKSAVVGSTTTTAFGTYSIKIKIKRAATFQSRFAGSTFGVHPNDVVCFASSSNKVRVTIK